jgi:hypothetical protein
MKAHSLSLRLCARQVSLMQKSGQIIAEILDDDLVTNESETTIELNLCRADIQTHYQKAEEMNL